MNTGREPLMGTARHGFVEAGTLTTAPENLRPVYRPTPDTVESLLAPPSTPLIDMPVDVPVETGTFSPRRLAIRTGVAARGRSRSRGDFAITIAAIGLGICLGIGVYATKPGLDLPGGTMLVLGTLSALVGTYLCLMLLLLVSRLPWLEREVGHDRMVSLHRKVAPYSLLLILLHVIFTTVSYAQAEDHSVLGQLWSLITKSAWMVPAAASFVIMMGMGVLSYRKIRMRMRYETWWVAHLYFYIAVALSFGHQIALGPMFISHPFQRYFWTALYLGVAATILIARVIIPLSNSRKHELKVEMVVPEANGVVSVYISGIDLDLLKARGGQFFQWRFMTREWWWQSHPYSLSATPNSSWLRITVKDLGDQSSMLRRLHPGTRVVAEGPYGVFTAAARHGESVAAFAAGVGITPVRAVLDDLPHGTAVTLVYRVPDRMSAPLRDELEELVTSRGWRLHYLQGPREMHPLTPDYLCRLVPGLSASDVYVCGPDSFTNGILEAVREAGVPDRRIHHEAFSF